MKDVIPQKQHVGNALDDSNEFSTLAGVRYRASGNLWIAKADLTTMLPVRGRTRSAIVHFSAGCGIRMRRYLRECRADYGYMVTLTYPSDYPSDGRRVKEHLRRYIQEAKRYDFTHNPLATEPWSCFWFLEFQERGAPHFHIFFNRCPPKDFNSSTWYRIVASNDEKHLRAGTRTEKLQRGRAGTISYASKYAAKACQKQTPFDYQNVGRFWGVSGDRMTLSAAVFVTRADYANEQVKNSVKSMFSALKLMIEERQARIYKQEDGLLIVILLTDTAKTTMLMYTQAIEALYDDERNLFYDAELG